MLIYKATKDFANFKEGIIFNGGQGAFHNHMYVCIDGVLCAIDPSEYEAIEVDSVPRHYAHNKFKYEDGNFVYVKAEDEEADKWADVRIKRNQLLDESDDLSLSRWQDRWLAQSEEVRSAWTTYRQALRDIPTAFENADDVVWPDLPTV